jgi:hypothetical protein
MDGTETYGWVFIDFAKELVEKPIRNYGWCQNERPPNEAEIDGDDRIVEQPPGAGPHRDSGRCRRASRGTATATVAPRWVTAHLVRDPVTHRMMTIK